MAARLLDVDPQAAEAHADTAVRRAGRVAAVRQMRGMVAYRAGEFQLALAEFRTARRLGGTGLLPLIVDSERGLGRTDRALELAAEAENLAPAERIELAIVVSGIRRDLGQPRAALLALRGPALDPARRDPWSARLFYAYAEALAADGRLDEARDWFAHASLADRDLETDAAERLDDLDGVVHVDLLDGEDDEDDERDEDSERDERDEDRERDEDSEGDEDDGSEPAGHADVVEREDENQEDGRREPGPNGLVEP
ncbi:hypothetical protein [Piscicoccus intestinalis]|uniref:hypothetical protein n=1 Tax=Piscicoccus intestinalis TaxID=746033 RepID=UPI000A6ADBF9|nr:hypothetical protein [Piscicoccus intestinalis]